MQHSYNCEGLIAHRKTMLSIFSKNHLLPSVFQTFCVSLAGNLISHPSRLLTFSTIVHSFTVFTQSVIQSTNSPSSSILLFHCLSCTASFLLYTSFFLSFLISNSLPFPNSHSYPSVCLPLLSVVSLSFSLVLSLGYRKWFLSRSRGLKGCTHCPKQRGHCVNPPKIQRRKGRPIKIRNLLSSASLIQTHTHIHTFYLCCSHAKAFL